MRGRKINLIVLFAAVLSLLAGCGDVDSGANMANKEKQAEVSGSQEEVVEQQVDTAYQEEIFEVGEPAPTVAYSGIDGKLRSKILREIKNAREGVVQHNYDIHTIQSFYCLDNLDFPGFKLKGGRNIFYTFPIRFLAPKG